ncbi:MAG: M42 family metallopeptidase [Cytophagales bacterium]
MSMNTQLLKKLSETPGAPGFEKPIRDFVYEQVKSFTDSQYIDSIGNLIAIKKSGIENAPKLVIAAHLDEIGFIVTHIDNNGFVRFNTLGGFDPKTLTAQRVIVHGKKDLIGIMGSKPIHVMSPEERNAVPKIQDYFIDLGMKKEEVEALVSIGDCITRERELIEIGNCFNGKSLDNRVSVFVLIEALRKINNPKVDVYAAFTVQEEMGGRGAFLVAHNINPDFGIAIDTTIAYDVPGAKEQEMVTKLGEGVAIKIMDSSVICDSRMVKFLKETATKNNIKWQPEILTGGNTDTGPLQRMGKMGSIAGALSLPTRHIHQVVEMVHKNDIENAINLLVKSVENILEVDWSW